MLNVILPAGNREIAKRKAFPILLNDPDKYIVQPIVENASSTVFIMGSMG